MKEEAVTPAPPTSNVKATLPLNHTPEKKKEEEWDLPHTITKLESPSGGQIYLVGTAHFSKESQEDVAKVQIKAGEYYKTMSNSYLVITVEKLLHFNQNLAIM